MYENALQNQVREVQFYTSIKSQMQIKNGTEHLSEGNDCINFR